MISTIPLDYILQLIYGSVDPKGNSFRRHIFDRRHLGSCLPPPLKSQRDLIFLVGSTQVETQTKITGVNLGLISIYSQLNVFRDNFQNVESSNGT